MVDMDKRLDGLSPEAVDEWVAFRRLERDPDEWLREIVKRGFAAVVAASGGKIDPDDIDPAKEEKATPVVSPREAAEQAALILQR